MKVFILLSFAAVAFATRDCGENSHYESCGTACPLTCKNYENPPKVCVLMCNPGCHCDKGYIKTDEGRCVLPEECPAQIEPGQKSCVGEAETGLCKAYIPSWYYDEKSETCKQFVYGGCGGNGNRYKTEKECMNNCKEVCGENEAYTNCGTACPLTCDNYQNPPKACTLQCVTGCQCEHYFVKTRDGRCVRPEECPASAPEQKSCLGEAETGLCRAYVPSWYYDVKSGSCKEFIYGGCGGNGNRYKTEKECMDNCGDVLNESSIYSQCELPADTGPCRAFRPMYYFDKVTRQCKEFIYGGCLGNWNNFANKIDCEKLCGNAV